MPKIQLKPLYNSRHSPLEGKSLPATQGLTPTMKEFKSIHPYVDSHNHRQSDSFNHCQSDSPYQVCFDSQNQATSMTNSPISTILKGNMPTEGSYWANFTESEVPRESLCKTLSCLTQTELNAPPHLLTPSSWIDKFRDIYNNDKYLLKCWFWDNFNWNQNTIWIGKYHCIDQLPESNEEIIKVLNQLMSNLDKYPQIKSQVYLKFYFSRNIETNQPEINYLMLCNHQQLPAEFLNTTINQSFEKYQLTKAILDLDQDFKKMVNHYLNWSNFYIYYSLMEELQY
jgi:hypothetical protein